MSTCGLLFFLGLLSILRLGVLGLLSIVRLLLRLVLHDLDVVHADPALINTAPGDTIENGSLVNGNRSAGGQAVHLHVGSACGRADIQVGVADNHTLHSIGQFLSAGHLLHVSQADPALIALAPQLAFHGGGAEDLQLVTGMNLADDIIAGAGAGACAGKALLSQWRRHRQ